MNKDKKGHVDLDSVHDKLADNYKIDKNINSKVSTSIKDFKSVSDTINKFEKIKKNSCAAYKNRTNSPNIL